MASLIWVKRNSADGRFNAQFTCADGTGSYFGMSVDKSGWPTASSYKTNDQGLNYTPYYGRWGDSHMSHDGQRMFRVAWAPSLSVHHLAYSHDYGASWNDSSGNWLTRYAGNMISDRAGTKVWCQGRNEVINTNKIHYSPNGGVSYSLLTAPLNCVDALTRYQFQFAVDDSGAKLWACCENMSAPAANQTLFYSTDQGTSWTSVTVPFAAATPYRARVACDSTGTKLIVAQRGSPGGIWTSDDSGSSWTSRTVDASGDNFYWSYVSMSDDASKILLGAWNYTQSKRQLFYSSDGGVTWSKEMEGGTGALHVEMARNGQRAMVCQNEPSYGGNTWYWDGPVITFIPKLTFF